MGSIILLIVVFAVINLLGLGLITAMVVNYFKGEKESKAE